MSEFFFEHEEMEQKHPSKVEVVHNKHLTSVTDNVIIETKVTELTPVTERMKKDCQDNVLKPQRNVEPYKGIEIDSKEENLLALLSTMEGSPWVVEYYQQYLGADDEPSGFNIDTIHAFQQYRLIKNLEIRVESALSYNHNQEDQTDELTGTARCYPFMKPNVGDMFIADIGDGRSALLEVDEVKRLSHRVNAIYEIDYHVKQYLNENVHAALKSKVVDEYIFDVDRMRFGTDPLLSDDAYKSLAEMESKLDRLTRIYFSQFYNNETSSIDVPLAIGVRTADPYFVKFVQSIVDMSVYPMYRKIRNLRINSREMDNIISVWDAIVNIDWLLMDNSRTYFTLVTKDHYRGQDRAFGPQHGLYQYIVYHGYENVTGTPFTYNERFSAPAELPIFINEDTSRNQRYIYQVGMNGDYVFSQYFYLGDKANMSRLENQLFKFLNHEPLCLTELNRLMDACVRWDDLDRYYYIPVLLLLGKMLVGGWTGSEAMK